MVQTEDSMDSDIGLHTIHIRGLNKNLSYLDAKKLLQSYFEIQFSGQIVEIQVIPSYDILMNLIDQKFIIEAYINKYKILNEKNPRKRAFIKGLCSKSSIDGEIYHSNWLKINDKMLDFYRRLNTNKNTGNAFISFSDPYIVNDILKDKSIIYNQAHNFYGQLLKIKDWNMSLAPPPSDILWENIKYTRKYRIVKMFIFTAILFFLCLIVITPAKVNIILII